MKLIVFFLVFFTTFSISHAQDVFSTLPESNDSTYGYSKFNPLKMKKGNSSKSIDFSVQFLKGLRTLDNQKLIYISRYSLDDPNYHSSIFTNRSSGMPVNGKLGILDQYVFVTSEKKDTIFIYVDIYNKGKLFIPKGLRYEKDHNQSVNQ